MATRFYVDRREDYERGREFGNAGPYERITARVAADSGEGIAEVLKPRDPARGNGTLLLEVNPTSKLSRRPRDLEQGFTFVTLTWQDPATLQAGVREMVMFLKVTGGPMLLGDQPRFLKRAIVAGDRSVIGSGPNADAKGRTLIDGWMPASGGAVDLSKVQPVTQ